MSHAVMGLPIVAGIAGKLQHEELHAIFQDVGSGKIAAAYAAEKIQSRGCISTRNHRSFLDNDMTWPGIIEKLIAACSSNPDMKERICNAINASRLLFEYDIADKLSRGHMWRIRLHVNPRGGKREILTMLQCMSREVDQGGLGEDVGNLLQKICCRKKKQCVEKKCTDFETLWNDAIELRTASRKRSREIADMYGRLVSKEHEAIDRELDATHGFIIPRHASFAFNPPSESEHEEELESEDESYGPDHPYSVASMASLEAEILVMCDEEDIPMLKADLAGKTGKQRWIVLRELKSIFESEEVGESVRLVNVYILDESLPYDGYESGAC